MKYNLMVAVAFILGFVGMVGIVITIKHNDVASAILTSGLLISSSLYALVVTRLK